MSPNPAPRRVARWCAVNVVLLIVFVAICRPAFETHDDPTRVLIASGKVLGEPSEHLVYSNIVVGRLLARAYTLAGGVPWYALLLLAAHVLASTTILVTLLESGARRGLLAYAVLLVGFELPALQSLEFTVTAAWCAVAALLGLFAWEKRAGRARLALALACVGVAWAIREPAVLLVGLVSAPWLVVRLLEGRRALLVRRGLAAAAIVLVLTAVDRAHHAGDEGWSAFREYQHLREEIHGRPTLARGREREEALRAAGWSENDARMFSAYFHADPERFGAERLRAVVDVAGDRTWHSGVWRTALLELLRSNSTALALLTAGLVAAFAAARRRATSVGLVACAVAVVGVCLVLLVTHKLPPRVATSAALAFAGVGCAVWTAGRARWPARPLLRVAALVGLGVLLASSARQLVDRAARHAEAAAELAEFRAGLEDCCGVEPLYLAWGYAFPGVDVPALGGGIETLGAPWVVLGWPLQSPLHREALARHGVEDVYTALVDDPRVHLICARRQEPLLVEYLREHYGERVRIEVLAEFGEWRRIVRVRRAAG